jgi:hypothetical protein
MLLNQEESSPCYHVGPIHALFFCIIRIASLLFNIISIISKIGDRIWVCFHCRKLANQHINHMGSVSIQTKSIRDSIIKHQSVFSHYVRCSSRPIRIGLADVRKPTRMQLRFELTTQLINSRCTGCAFFLPDVIGNSEIDHTNLHK